MKRDQKSIVIDELAEDIGAAEAIFAVDYKGISVTQAAELRTRLRESDAQFKVVKNRLAKLAAEKSGTENLDDLLRGPIALTLIKGDAVLAAKTITTFSRENDVLEYRGGLMDGAPLDAENFAAIARLPGRDILYGQLVGLAASPLTGLVAGLSNLISGLGRQLAQIAEQGLVTGEAPEPAAPVEEPTPAEAPVEEPPAEEPPPEPQAESPKETEPGSDPSTPKPEDSAEAGEGSDPTEAGGTDEGSDPTNVEGEEPEAPEEPETENETETESQED